MYKEGFICCDNFKKELILKSRCEIKNYIFITSSDLLSVFYGKCETNAIYLLMKEYNISYDLASECIFYIPYIDLNKEYDNEKLNNLSNMKKFLINNNAFSKDELLLYRLKQYPITLIDYPCSKVFTSIKNELKKITEVYEVENEVINKDLDVYVFDTAHEEARFICSEIIKLNKKGISNFNIYVENITDELSYELKRMISTYNIPLSLSKQKNIKSTKVASLFLEYLNKYNSFNEVFNNLEEYRSSDIYKKIFNLVVNKKLVNERPSDTYKYLNDLLADTSYKADIYKNMISTASMKSFRECDYVFYPSLNLGVAPSIYKDDKYLKDKELEIIGLDTSEEKTQESYNKLKKILSTTKNLTLSYVKKSGGIEAYPSNIFDEFNVSLKSTDDYFGYSKLEDEMELASDLSINAKYNTISQNLEKYDVSGIKFNTYDNKYKPIDKSLLVGKKRILSYSSESKYYECPFKYYCSKILGIDEFKDSDATILGSFVHAVLENSYDNDFDDLFDIALEEVKKEKKLETFSNKQLFYAKLMYEDVCRLLVSFNKEYELKNGFNHNLECEINSSTLPFKGIVDKILWKEENGVIYAVIVDYKTGTDEMDLFNVEDGFNLQLPSYMYLISEYEKFLGKEIKIIGVYLQKVNRIITKDKKATLDDAKKDDFRLTGYTINNYADYIKFDLDELYVKKTFKKDHTSGSNSRVMSYTDESNLIDLTKDLILKAHQNINDACFEISPKVIKDEKGVTKKDSCEYCSMKDVCYKKYDDIKYLNYKKFE